MSTEPHWINVAWPPITLAEAGWRRRLEAISEQAEARVGRPCGLQQSAELALELVGLIWPALGPETVAATARASLLLGQPVLMATSPADQLQEIADRLDAIWQQAQTDPAAAVVSVPAPLLQVVREPKTRAPRKRPKVEPLEVEPDPEPDQLELPEPDPLPSRTLRPLSERVARKPAPPAAEPERIEAPLLPEHLAPSLPEPEPAPAPPPQRQPRPRSSPPPPGWFSAAEVCELLEVEPCSVARWRKAGRLGDEGTGWHRTGRIFYFSPDAVEKLDRSRIPAGLDQLVAEIQAH